MVEDWNWFIKTTASTHTPITNVRNYNCDSIVLMLPEGEVKRSCEYCHGVTFDDSHGHCCACGAPRSR